jgi:hypothetical protein
MIDVSLPLWLLAVQWTLLIALTALVIIMYRQMGYYLGVSESGTENVGLDIGAAAEAFSYTQVAPEIKGGQRFEPSGRWSLLLFIDPSCSGCERSLAALDALREEGSLMGLQTLIVTGADPRQIAANPSLRKREGLALVEREVAEGIYGIQRVPFAYVVDPAGHVRAKGSADSQAAWRRLTAVSERPPIPLISKAGRQPSLERSSTGG